MIRPEDFTFTIDFYPEIGETVGFYYKDFTNDKDLWDNLEFFLQRFTNYLYRLKESSYEISPGVSFKRVEETLLDLGFKK